MGVDEFSDAYEITATDADGKRFYEARIFIRPSDGQFDFVDYVRASGLEVCRPNNFKELLGQVRRDSNSDYEINIKVTRKK